MRAVVARVREASVTVGGQVVSELTAPGVFGASMAVASVNDGPFTVLVEV